MLRRLYEATWGRLVAWSYDWFMSSSEEAGLRERRREVLREASGRCLEIGAGTGLNLPLWPQAVESLALTEPDSHMAAQLRKRVARSDRPSEVIEASGEALPFRCCEHAPSRPTLTFMSVETSSNLAAPMRLRCCVMGLAPITAARATLSP